MKLEPKGEHILIEVIERSDVLSKQISKRIPGFEYSKGHVREGYPQVGIIYGIGDGCPEDLEYKVGDTVVFDVAEVDGFVHEGHKLFPAHWDSPKAIIKGGLDGL